MEKILGNRWLQIMLRLFLGGVFIYASVDKIAHPDQFARAIYNYRILPGELVNLLAIWLPWLEIATGAFLIFGVWLRASALLLTVQIAMFFIAASSALARGLNFACGCFTTDPKAQSAGITHLFLDGGLLLIALVILFFARRPRAGTEPITVPATAAPEPVSGG